MKKNIVTLLALMLSAVTMAQKIEFEEYDLANGLHVILHQERGTPITTTGVLYHVGGKDDAVGKTGFAHFFEHLLFEGTKNIKRGKWFDIVSSHGGKNNAYTTSDITYYYEIFPSNNLQLGLWMEAERMLHPIINQIGIDTQKEVVKEEKRQRNDNAPYGKIMEVISKNLFKEHPYKQTVIGSMEDLSSAELDDFLRYSQKYYNPNNAVLVVAGDFDKEQVKQWIEEYFGNIPNKSEKVKRNYPQEEPINQEIKTVEYDANITLPMKLFVYRTPKKTDKDAIVFDFISAVLSDGKSSRLYKTMVDTNKEALEVITSNNSMEDYGIYMIGAIPLGEITMEQLGNSIDKEIENLQMELISEREFQKLQNQFETSFVRSNNKVEGIARSLVNNYIFYKDTNRINKEQELYRQVTREDIRRVAREYLNKNQRLNLDYLPKN